MEPEPGATRSAPISWVKFPTHVAIEQPFSVTVIIPSLFCAESGRLVTRQRVGTELVIDLEWRGVIRGDDVCDDPGGGPYVETITLSGLPGPAGRTFPVRSGEFTYGVITVEALGRADFRAGGHASFFRDTSGCDRMAPLFSGSMFGSHVLGDPPPPTQSITQRVFVTGRFETRATPLCGDTVVFRIETP